MTTPDADVDVPNFLRTLGIPGLVDIHVHFMPPNVLAKVWAYFDRGGALVSGSWPIQYRFDEAQRIEILRRLGVRAWTALAYPHRPDMARWLNRYTLRLADEVPECALSATFYPEPDAARYVDDAIHAGARVFKAHVQVGAYDPRDPLLRPVWGALQDAQIPVVAHVGSGPAPGRFTGPAPFGAVLRQFPRLVAVIAHMGMPEYGEFLAYAESYERVHLDTTMVFTDFTERGSPYPPELLPRLLALQDRVVLGSDFPNIPHPYAHQLAALARLDLGEDWLRAVCHDNGGRLLGIG